MASFGAAALHVAADLTRVTWPHLHANDGDTLVVIDFSSDQRTACNGKIWNKAEFMMDSKILLQTGSSVFTQMLSDRAQQRQRRRHRMKDADLERKGVRFVLDLTPPTEGEESASLVADLSLPAGVRDWWMAKERLGVPELVVCGHDDVCPNHALVPNNCDKNTDPDTDDPNPNDEIKRQIAAIDKFEDNKLIIQLGLEQIQPSLHRQIPEYCPIRHRMAIIRLLFFLRDNDLVLDSAPRVWTIIGVAKALDIAGTIQSPIRAWLEGEFNSDFIDVHPEAALEMAWRLQLEDLARVSLRIIVAERALESGSRVKPVTLFGRPRGDLSDDIETVVEYATIAVKARVKEANEGLASDPLKFLGVAYWRRFRQLGDSLNHDLLAAESESHIIQIQRLLDQYHFLSNNLVECVRFGLIRAFATLPYTKVQDGVDNDRWAYVRKDAFDPFRRILEKMTHEQLLLTRNFWTQFRDRTLELDSIFYRSALRQAAFWKLEMDIFKVMSQGILKNVAADFRCESLPLKIKELHSELSTATRDACQTWAPYTDSLEIAIQRTNHLALGLAESELKFLPLWAGGFDDGTGGVFQETPLPDADMGPSQPGPAYITGKTIAPSTTAASDITVLGSNSVKAVRSGAGNTDTSATLSSFTMESFVDVSSGQVDSDWDSRSFASPGSSVAPLAEAMGNLDVVSVDTTDTDTDADEIEMENTGANDNDDDDDDDDDDDVELLDDDDYSSDDTMTGSWSDVWTDINE